MFITLKQRTRAAAVIYRTINKRRTKLLRLLTYYICVQQLCVVLVSILGCNQGLKASCSDAAFDGWCLALLVIAPCDAVIIFLVILLTNEKLRTYFQALGLVCGSELVCLK